jgi:hypothetical protein
MLALPYTHGAWMGWSTITFVKSWLGNPLGIPLNSTVIPIPDLLNSGIFIGI